MFGKNYNQKASADFLKLLLIYIQKWGNTISGYPSSGRQTELSKVYQQLLKEKVSFPNEEEVLSNVDFSYKGLPSVSQSLPNFNKEQFLSYQPQRGSTNTSNQQKPDVQYNHA